MATASATVTLPPLKVSAPSIVALVGLGARLAGIPNSEEPSKWAELEAAFSRALPAERAKRDNVSLGGLRGLKAAVSELPSTFDFWGVLLPRILSSALDVARLFPDGAGLPSALRRGKNSFIELSESQVACLMAHGFFGSLEPLPRPEVRRLRGGHYDALDPAVVRAVDGELLVPHFGDPSWWRVIQSGSPVARERIKCFLAYWQQAPDGAAAAAGTAGRVIRFERVCLSGPSGAPLPDWAGSTSPLAPAAASLGRCEDVRGAAAVVDFANKDLHIATIIPSATQEECLFSIYPELFVGLAFCETMADAEALAASGLRRCSDYAGYLESFRWKQLTPGTAAAEVAAAAAAAGGETVIAVDALVVDSRASEAAEWSLRRELGKFSAGLESLRRLRAAAAARGSPAAAGAVTDDDPSEVAAPPPMLVATGNWGCGVFGGDRCVKFLQQLLAATVAGDVALDFACVRDEAWARALSSMHGLLAGDLRYSAADLWRLLAAYEEDVRGRRVKGVQGPGGWAAYEWVMQHAARVKAAGAAAGFR